MSLRAFHIFFILTALAFMAFLGYWSGGHLLRGEDGQNWGLAITAAAGLLAGVPYLFWFVRKTKTLG